MAILDRVLSAVLALALMAVGLVVAVEIVVAGLGRLPWLVPHDRWLRWARTTLWSDTDLRLVFAGLIAAGALLLVVQAAPRRPRSLPLAAGTSGVVSELDRRGIERWLAERVAEVGEVANAGVQMRSRSAVVEVTSVSRDTRPVEQGVRQVAASSLESLELERTPRLRVRVRARGEQK